MPRVLHDPELGDGVCSQCLPTERGIRSGSKQPPRSLVTRSRLLRRDVRIDAERERLRFSVEQAETTAVGELARSAPGFHATNLRFGQHE